MPDHCVCVCVCVCVCTWVRAGGSVECMTDFQHLGSFVFREDCQFYRATWCCAAKGHHPLGWSSSKIQVSVAYLLYARTYTL